MAPRFNRIATIVPGLLALALSALMPGAAWADNCDGRIELDYPSSGGVTSIGDTVRIRLVLGAGNIRGGTELTINRVRFELDCEAGYRGLNCVDEGAIVSYLGNLTTTCPTTISSSHAAGDAFPNQVVLTPATPIVIPSNADSFCAIEFDVRIEAFPGDATPDCIEQVAGVSSSQNDGVCNTVPTLATGSTSSGSIRLSDDCNPVSCNGRVDLSHPFAGRFSPLGTTIRPRITLGAGTILGGSHLTINAVRFELDCAAGNLGLNCVDEGAIVSYLGNLTTTCPTTISVSHGAGDAFPNQVVLTPATPIVIPSNVDDFCAIEFDTRIETFPADATPDVVEEVAGFSASQNDGVCNTDPTLTAGSTSSGSIQLCNCDDGNICTDDYCDSAIGCIYPPNSGPCDDGDACTTNDRCAGGVCLGQPLCDDGNVCTDDSCNYEGGCAHACNASCGPSPRKWTYWKHVCRQSGQTQPGERITLTDVDCVNDTCAFAAVTTEAQLCAYLTPNPNNDGCKQAEREFMALMLNICKCRLSEGAPIDSGCTTNTTIAQSREDADTIICDPARTHATCSRAECESEEINEGNTLLVNSLMVQRVEGEGVRLSWQPPYTTAESSQVTAYRIWRKDGNDTAFAMIGHVNAGTLTFLDSAATGDQVQYELSTVY